MEARIFSQAANIDRLLSKLRSLDPARDNLAEDEELQVSIIPISHVCMYSILTRIVSFVGALSDVSCHEAQDCQAH